MSKFLESVVTNLDCNDEWLITVTDFSTVLYVLKISK